MRILVLGGPKFLGRGIIDAALARGHELTLFNRGKTNPEEYPEVEIRTFSPAIIAAMKKANGELLEEHAANDPVLKEILDSQSAYRKMARKWTEISDYAYLKDNLE